MRALVRRRLLASWILLIVSLWGVAQADQNSEWFRQANDLYRNNRFQEALDIYQRILDGGFESGALYYNMGNCHYRLGHLGESILYYEKARRLIPEDEDLKANLALTEAKTVDKITPLPRFWLLDGLETFVFWFPRAVLWILLAVAYVGATVAWIVRLLSDRSRRRTWVSRVALALVVVGSVSGAVLGIRAGLSRERTAIVLAGEVKAYSGPGEGTAQVFVLHEGTKVRLDKRSADWIEITLADGNVGWVPESTLAEI